MRNASLLVVLLCLGAGRYSHADSLSLPARNVLVTMAQVETICLHYGLTELWSTIESNPPIHPFSSDGCSVWPDSWFKGRDLYDGCFIHDLHYWAGMPGDEMGRMKADVWLMLWVADHVSIELAEAIFNGVRVGGSEKLNTPWRWGFGRIE